ncbi:MAG: TRAP transporter small permease [Halomonas sp.]|jgi:TRAP-type C4-dicarboxylate transport system permease small subunit|uniref:TRAP transporter small permease protein n=1 Tax=Billgrantia tianxiuensis TaxID=2497861 RepID=A0A6I6SNS3_9GAMM|nr:MULTISPECIES: TRAP transporter small permease [Halomonas]MCE8031805.1 TRAP transporter small permease [Halomonas sp. MCCC 1A11057]MDX5434395.1 TRAP transporter small permease [Halomonas sp.]QHC50094.1 TRAP transporter small permease [Halomonas tianxiuensis]
MIFKFNALYRLGAWGAAACMVVICALVALQVTFRLVDALLVLVGMRRLGLGITGVSEIASYLLVGATFLGLAYTFVHHAHIRVTLLISRLPSALRAWFEVFCLLVALVISLLLGYGLVELARESREFNDVSSGFLSIPLWIPQTVLATGVGLLCLALAEALATTLRIAIREPHRFREEAAVDDSDLP